VLFHCLKHGSAIKHANLIKTTEKQGKQNTQMQQMIGAKNKNVEAHTTKHNVVITRTFYEHLPATQLFKVWCILSHIIMKT